MKNEFWLNLATKDLKRCKEFYTAIGFELNIPPGNPDNMVSIKAGNKGIIINFFNQDFFKSFSHNEVADASATEVFLNLDAASREEVNEFAEKVKAAGGTIIGGPGETDGWMYGCGFADPDGHRWGILFMDMTQFKG